MCASLDLRDPVGACLLLKDAANGNTKGLSSQAMLLLAVKAAVSQTKQGMLGCTMQHLPSQCKCLLTCVCVEGRGESRRCTRHPVGRLVKRSPSGLCSTIFHLSVAERA